ncbi:DUF1348 family protein [Mycobacterium canettii]|nr:DUF1348 family protein [Mycobacterium canetti]
MTRKWQRELDYSLRKSLWSFHDNRIAMRFQYESRDRNGQWYRSYGTELWRSQHQRRADRRIRASLLRCALGIRVWPGNTALVAR